MQPYAQTYRDPGAERLYLCGGCSSPQRAPAQGGMVVCTQCRTQTNLPDRSALLGAPPNVGIPSNDPAHLAQLRAQDGRPLVASPSLVAVLGGPSIQPGRDQEAILVWNNLRGRAAQGDVAASEDLATLTMMLAQLPSRQGQPDFDRAIFESAFDASVLPRHKQQHLGGLARHALVRGDRAGAQRYLSWMTPNAPELEADSQLRLSSAVAATVDRDPQRVLALLGPQKSAVPIADFMDDLACVFRAHAHETMNNLPAAQAALGELSSPASLPAVQQVYAPLQICTRSAGGYLAQKSQVSAQRAASSAGKIGRVVGVILGLVGLSQVGLGLGLGLGAGLMVNLFLNGGIGVILVAVGLTLFLRGQSSAKHAAWLAVNGISLEARIVSAAATGTLINNVPVLLLNLQVNGPQGPYAASFRKLVNPFEAGQLVGRSVRVRANPQKLDDVIVDEG